MKNLSHLCILLRCFRNRRLSRLRITTAVTLSSGAVAMALLAAKPNLASALPHGAVAPITAHASRVSVGSPAGHTPQNHQNEPAIAMDAHNPDFLIAGANDFIDLQPCPRDTAIQRANCEDFTAAGFTPGIGISGVYFSFDRGRQWIQPSYTGWSDRRCEPETLCVGEVGPIGTLPWYYEAGLIALGDPAVAVGPRPVNGRFSWGNGSRVYYANLAADFPGRNTLRGYEAIAVSRLDNPTPASVQEKSSWMPPVIVSRHQMSPAYHDKDQIWADNAASSPYFGNVYVCSTQFRSNAAPPAATAGYPEPLIIGTSSDGGNTWRTKQITPAEATGYGPGGYGIFSCTVRTDSHGIVYVFADRLESPIFGMPTHGSHVLLQSFDGGSNWTNPRTLFTITDPCFFKDPLSGACVMDGYTGARNAISSVPSIDIANGAPTGTDATNMIVNAWVDANDGLNNERARIAWSLDGGASWQGRTSVSLPGDRPIYAAPAISPAGDRIYLVYEAATSPWRGSDLSSPRPYHGVLLTAPVTANGPGAWTTVYAGTLGDLRGTYPGHLLREERIGDYVYAAASRDYGVGVWTDARDAGVCPAIQDWRATSLAAGQPVIPAPWPLADCPPTFGNTDIWAAATY
jgi:hypothetical protein